MDTNFSQKPLSLKGAVAYRSGIFLGKRIAAMRMGKKRTIEPMEAVMASTLKESEPRGRKAKVSRKGVKQNTRSRSS